MSTGGAQAGRVGGADVSTGGAQREPSEGGQITPEIHAVLRRGRAAAGLTFLDGRLQGSGSKEVLDELAPVLVPNTYPWFNPRRGGPYLGFDPADPVQVLDALQFMRRRGLDVEIHTAQVPELDAPPVGYGTLDLRDENAIREAVRATAPEIGDDEEPTEAGTEGEA